MRTSRRARLILALLVLTAITLIALDVSGGSAFTGLRSAASTVFGPIESAVGGVLHPVGRFLAGVDGGSSDEALRKQNARLHHKLAASAGMRRELADLKGLTGLAGEGRFRILPAHVVAIGAAGTFEWTATIDVGSADGVHRDMTVMNGDGLVGKTERVHAHTSTVLLAIDPKAHPGARLEGSGETGYMTGKGLSEMTFTLLNSNVTLHPGERLVTLGPGDAKPYVAELPIGTITKVESTPGALTRTATVRPFVSFTSLSSVGVVVNNPSVPRDSLLPPKPKGKTKSKASSQRGNDGGKSTGSDQQPSSARGSKP